jgi:hypothetical protein
VTERRGWIRWDYRALGFSQGFPARTMSLGIAQRQASPTKRAARCGAALSAARSADCLELLFERLELGDQRFGVEHSADLVDELERGVEGVMSTGRIALSNPPTEFTKAAALRTSPTLKLPSCCGSAFGFFSRFGAATGSSCVACLVGHFHTRSIALRPSPRSTRPATSSGLADRPA